MDPSQGVEESSFAAEGQGCEMITIANMNKCIPETPSGETESEGFDGLTHVTSIPSRHRSLELSVLTEHPSYRRSHYIRLGPKKPKVPSYDCLTCSSSRVHFSFAKKALERPGRGVLLGEMSRAGVWKNCGSFHRSLASKLVLLALSLESEY